MANEIDTAFLIKATIENNDEAPGVEGSQTKQNGKLGTSLNLGKMTIDEVYTLAKEFVRGMFFVWTMHYFSNIY